MSAGAPGATRRPRSGRAGLAARPIGALTTRLMAALTTGLMAALLAACGRPAEALAACHLPAGATVLAIGDSLTRGHGAGGQGYAEQLQALLAAAPAPAGVSVVNAGVDGERSAGLLARIDSALAEHRPAVVLITSGGNDFLRRVPEAETRRHLAAVVERVRGSGAYAVLFGIPAPSLGAAVGLAREHALYEDLADAAGAHVIQGVVAEVLSRDALKSDRIHPNRAGYAAMAQAAFELLQRCR